MCVQHILNVFFVPFFGSFVFASSFHTGGPLFLPFCVITVVRYQGHYVVRQNAQFVQINPRRRLLSQANIRLKNNLFNGQNRCHTIDFLHNQRFPGHAEFYSAGSGQANIMFWSPAMFLNIRVCFFSEFLYLSAAIFHIFIFPMPCSAFTLSEECF